MSSGNSGGDTMTTETKLVHGAGHGPGVAAAHCGLPFTADLRLTAKRGDITCPACLTAMGEPRVVSGTDAVAATTEPTTPRMTMYDALQAFEAIRGTTRVGEAAHGIATLAVQQIRALGTVPAPAETPPPLRTCARCGKRNARESDMCKQCIDDTAETPAPPGPVKHEPWCGRKRVRCWSAGHAECFAAEGQDECRCSPSCRVTAAPAPGVGEGARELTFAEAYPQYLAKPGSVECQDGDGRWTEFKPVFPWTPETVLMVLGWSYRLKPEPLPAPAPKPGRVVEMAHGWSEQGCPPVGGLLAAVVDAHQEEIRREWVKGGKTADILARARVAMLGAEAGK